MQKKILLTTLLFTIALSGCKEKAKDHNHSAAKETTEGTMTAAMDVDPNEQMVNENPMDTAMIEAPSYPTMNNDPMATAMIGEQSYPTMNNDPMATAMIEAPSYPTMNTYPMASNEPAAAQSTMYETDQYNEMPLMAPASTASMEQMDNNPLVM